MKFLCKPLLPLTIKTNSMYSPFLFLLINLVIGIYLKSIFPLVFPIIIICFCMFSIILVFIHIRFSHWLAVKTIVLNALFLCTGWLALHLQQQHNNLLHDKIAHRPISLMAIVTDKHVQAATKPRWEQGECFECAVFEYFLEPHVQPPLIDKPILATFNVQCFVKRTTTIQVGDTILIKNIIIKPPLNKTLSGGQSYTDFLIKEGFIASFFLSNAKPIEIINRPLWCIRLWWWKLRNDTFQNIMTKLSPKTASYYSLIFLGKKDPGTTDQLRRTFNFWGLSHYLARSGLHIVLFILIWKWILCFLPVHILIKRILLVIICGFYGLLSWASTPFIRAYYSFLLIEIGGFFDCSIHFFHLLTTICMLILLFNPIQLFFLDFQLTFGLTFALSWLSSYIAKIQNK